jgi:ribosome biogenesis protein BMS1
MSDIVFLRCWYPLKPRKYCNPVSNLLIGEKKWKGMRLVRELRKENQVAIPQNPDSTYKTITDRPDERNFNPLKIPKKLIKELPFKTKPKLDTKRSKPTYLQKRAVILEADEKKLATLMHRINTIKNAKEKLRKEVTAKKKLERAKKLEKEQAIKNEKLRNVKKEAYKKLGKKEASDKRKVEMGDAAFSAKRARH